MDPEVEGSNPSSRTIFLSTTIRIAVSSAVDAGPASPVRGALMDIADFPISEFEARLDRAQAAMHEAGLDALFFTSEAEIRYFTGFRTLFWQSPTRPWFLVVPATGKPVAVIPEIGADLMRRTWLDDIRTWASPHPADDGISILADVLQPKARVGMPMGRETALRMPLMDFTRLCELLSDTVFEDATGLVQSLRMIKSPAEIDKLAAICGIASTSFAAAPELFCTGQTRREAFRAFKIALLKNGAEEVPYLVGGAGPGGYSDVISPAGEDVLQSGDVLMLDTGATLDGYFCDFDRNFAFSHADDTAKAAYATLYRATDAALDVARPGTTCRELHAVMMKIIGGDGGQVGRLGHGLGMQLTEPPSIVAFDDTELQAGMVLTLEPSLQIGETRMMVHEENIVIRDGLPQLLSRRAAPELPIL